MKELTPKQKQILDFITNKKFEGEPLPTLEEIQSHFKFKAIATVQDHLKALERKGYIQRSSRARSIQILGLNLNPGLNLPILGRIAAGAPILAAENIEGYLSVDRDIAKGENLFLLRIKGDSMIEAGILDGDLVVVRLQEKIQPGQIGVFLMDREEATVKFLERKNKRFFLVPANKNYPLIGFRKETKIIGKVVALIRKYV